MKKIIYLFLALSFCNITNIFAQQQQNDATWEETISFLEDNARSMRGKIIWASNHKAETLETTISNNKTVLTVTNKTPYGDGFQIDIRNINLSDLSYISLDEGQEHSYIMLWSREKGSVNCKKDNSFSPCNFIEIGIENKEMKNRVVKALKHLAYLSNKKNEEKKAKSKF